MLKFVYASEDEIPEGMGEHYTESNGKWILNCEGAVPTAKLDEFRENNVELRKKVEAYGDLTPEKAQELREKQKQIEEAEVKDDDEKIKELVNSRVAKMKEDLEAEKTAIQEKLDETQNQLAKRTIDSALVEAGGEFGLRSTAHADAIARGREIFSLDENGEPVALKPDGEKEYGRDGKPLTPREWVENLTKDAPHLFEPSEGAGGQGSGAGGGSGATKGGNPFSKETYNLTRQAQLLKDNPQKARQLAAQAGVTI